MLFAIMFTKGFGSTFQRLIRYHSIIPVVSCPTGEASTGGDDPGAFEGAAVGEHEPARGARPADGRAVRRQQEPGHHDEGERAAADAHRGARGPRGAAAGPHRRHR